MKIKNDKFQIDIIDKRDSFPVSIVRLSEKSSNIHPQISGAQPEIFQGRGGFV